MTFFLFVELSVFIEKMRVQKEQYSTHIDVLIIAFNVCVYFCVLEARSEVGYSCHGRVGKNHHECLCSLLTFGIQAREGRNCGEMGQVVSCLYITSYSSVCLHERVKEV